MGVAYDVGEANDVGVAHVVGQDNLHVLYVCSKVMFKCSTPYSLHMPHISPQSYTSYWSPALQSSYASY